MTATWPFDEFERETHGWNACVLYFTNRGTMAAPYVTIESAAENAAIRRLAPELGAGRIILGGVVLDADDEVRLQWGEQVSGDEFLPRNTKAAFPCDDCGHTVGHGHLYRLNGDRRICLTNHDAVSNVIAHVDIPVVSASFRRGVEAARAARRLAIDELGEVILHGVEGLPGTEFARHYLARLVDRENREIE